MKEDVPMKLTKEGQAAQEAFRRYEIRGKTDNEFGGPPYMAPWLLIDVSKAEPDVNWRGELIAEYASIDEANAHLWNLVAAAVTTVGPRGAEKIGKLAST